MQTIDTDRKLRAVIFQTHNPLCELIFYDSVFLLSIGGHWMMELHFHPSSFQSAHADIKAVQGVLGTFVFTGLLKASQSRWFQLQFPFSGLREHEPFAELTVRYTPGNEACRQCSPHQTPGAEPMCSITWI